MRQRVIRSVVSCRLCGGTNVSGSSSQGASGYTDALARRWRYFVCGDCADPATGSPTRTKVQVVSVPAATPVRTLADYGPGPVEL